MNGFKLCVGVVAHPGKIVLYTIDKPISQEVVECFNMTWAYSK